jgi:hypothetical protein
MSDAADVPAAVAPRTEAAPLSKRRAIAVWSLVALATLITFVSALTLWVKRQALDTNAWVDASGQMLKNDDIRGALSIALVNALYNNVDVTAQVRRALPPKQQGLAPVVSGALRDFSERAANRLLASPRVQGRWEQVNRRVHKNLIAVLEGKDVRRFHTENGTVVLDLSPLVQRLAQRLGIQEKVKPDAGRITLLKSHQLDAAQTGFKVIKALTVFIALLVVVLYGLAIYLAGPGHRRRILRASAISLLFVGLLVLIVRRLAGNWIVDSLVKSDVDRPAGHAVWAIETELLRDIGIALLAYGVVGLFAAWLAGPTRWATSFRRWLAPRFREQPLIVFGAVAFLYLLVLLWGPTASTRQLLGILLLGALIMFGVEMLRRQTLEEFPAARTALPPAEGSGRHA